MLDSFPLEPLVDIEAEQELLALALIAPDRFAELRVGVELFSDPVHAALWEEMQRLHRDLGVLSLDALRRTVGDWQPITPTVTAREYVERIARNAVNQVRSPIGVVEHLEDLAARRSITSGINQLKDTIAAPTTSVREAAADFVTFIDTATAMLGTGRRAICSIGQEIAAIEAALDDQIDAGVSSGFETLDHQLGRMRAGDLIVPAGRPGSGKTTFAVGLATNVARAGERALVFSLEMTARDLATRIVSDLIFDDTPVEYRQIIRRSILPEQREALRRARDRFANLPLHIDDTRGVTVAEIGARARLLARKYARTSSPLRLIVVDYIGLIRATDRYRGNRVQEIAEITQSLKALAGELQLPVIALSQLNRGVEGRENKRPELSDLRDSGSIEQDADAVLFLYRPAYYLETKPENDPDKELERKRLLEECRNSLEVIVGKSRNGPRGVVPLWADMGCNAIRDLQQ